LNGHPLIEAMGRTGPRQMAEHIESPDPWETSFEGKTVVIGLGNPYMRDDAIGLRAAERLRKSGTGADVVIYEMQDVDVSLLLQFKGAKKIVVLDALTSGQQPGTVTLHAIAPGTGSLGQLPTLHSLQLHDLFDIASEGGLVSCPVFIVGAEPKSCEVGEGLSQEAEKALPVMVALAKEQIGGL
jgi:hydrogenase maturation protease